MLIIHKILRNTSLSWLLVTCHQSITKPSSVRLILRDLSCRNQLNHLWYWGLIGWGTYNNRDMQRIRLWQKGALLLLFCVMKWIFFCFAFAEFAISDLVCNTLLIRTLEAGLCWSNCFYTQDINVWLFFSEVLVLCTLLIVVRDERVVLVTLFNII